MGWLRLIECLKIYISFQNGGTQSDFILFLAEKVPGGGGFSWLPLHEKQGYLFEYVRKP